MKGVCLNVYTCEHQKHQGILLYEWLLETAKHNGLRGGSVFRAIAGFGRHKIIHEEHFFELASNVPVEVSFVGTKEDAEKFLKIIENEGIDVTYFSFPVDFGVVKKNQRLPDSAPQ
jgi:uncharacterized protein